MRERPTNVLLVTLDPASASMLRDAFEAGFANSPLVVAVGADEAFFRLRSGALPRERRLVLLDLGDRAGEGLAFLRALRADPELRAEVVVVLAAAVDPSLRAAAYELNAAGCMERPAALAATVELFEVLHRYWALVEMP